MKTLTIYPNSVYFTYGALSVTGISVNRFIGLMETITGLTLTVEAIEHIEGQRVSYPDIDVMIKQGEQL